MDEKTEELRDIFMEAADDGTVTERQEQTRGSLTQDEQQTDERIEEVVARMRENYEFETSLDDERLRELVRGFYAGADDAELAADLGVDESTVFRARLDLHLLREEDTEAAFDVDELRHLLVEGASTEEIAAVLDIPTDTAERYVAAVEAENEARRVSHRYRSELEDTLTDAGISIRHTADVQEDGLEDATEGMETNVSF